MMESHELYHNLRLSDIEFITKDNLSLFESYNIFTLGQLLGATKGLTKTQLLSGQSNKEELIQNLLDSVPDDFIEKYRTFSEDHPTGLLKKKNDENKTDNIDK